MPTKNSPINFTKAVLDTLGAAPSGKRLLVNDARCAGLQLVVTDRGIKTFYLYKRNAGKPMRFFLGHYPDLTVETARKKCEVARGRAAGGEDLRAVQRREKVQRATLADAFKAFLLARTAIKQSTRRAYGRLLETAFHSWKDRPFMTITKDKVATLHKQMTAERGPAQADKAMRFLRVVLNFAQFHYEGPDGKPPLPDNPVRRLSQTRAWNRVQRRTTYIKAHQFKEWFVAVLALKGDPANYEAVATADWLQLALLTGLRRSEGLGLKWCDVDLKSRTLTVRDTKNHDDHTLPLSDYLHGLLEARQKATESDETRNSEFVFASYGTRGHLIDPRDLLKRVVSGSGVSFTPHDLRRSFITVAEALDVSPYALKRLLNHRMTSDVTAGYIITDVDRLRRPMQQVTDFILRAAGLRESAEVASLDAAKPALRRVRQATASRVFSRPSDGLKQM